MREHGKKRVGPLKRAGLVFFGAAVFVLALEGGMRGAGALIKARQEYGNRVSASRAGARVVLCFGESTTAGQYPRYLEEALNKRIGRSEFSVIDKGSAGVNTGYIVSRLESEIKRYKPEFVVTMMGINDNGYHMPPESEPDSPLSSFVKSLRVYKLARFLELHIKAKLGEMFPAVPGASAEKDIYGEFIPVYGPQEKYTGAEKALIARMRRNPKDAGVYSELSAYYCRRLRLAEAEEVLRAGISLNPEEGELYAELGRLYADQVNYAGAKAMFSKAVEIDPGNAVIYWQAGRFYKNSGDRDKAGEMFAKAVSLEPSDPAPYIDMARFFADEGEYEKARIALEKLLGFDPGNSYASLLLAWIYDKQGDREKSGEILKNGGYPDPSRSLFLPSGLDGVLNPAGDYGNDDLFKWQERSHPITEDPATKANYIKAASIMKRLGVKWVCAQYPMRSIAPTEELFGDQDWIIYVDNEMAFKNAVASQSYNDYFVDNFAGTFGHCTVKGHKLLAGNIADAIIDDIRAGSLLRQKPSR